MAELRELVRRLRRKQSLRSIQRETGVHRQTLRKLQERADEHGWLDEASPLPNASAIETVWQTADRSEHGLAKFDAVFDDWVDKGYSFEVIHALIRGKGFSCSESTVRRYIQRRFPKKVRAVVRRATSPGDVMEVDFGYLGLTFDPVTDRTRKTWIFSGRLRHSRLAWREYVFDQRVETFLRCHENAFEYFSGVPAQVVVDNLKAAVIRAALEDFLLNRTYREFAEHYDFVISPCRPYTPQHKGGVESDIKYVKGNFWPRFREAQKLKGRATPSAGQLAEALEQWTDEVAEARLVRGVGRTPREIFESDERATLRPLPGDRFEHIEWRQCKVQADWRVQVARAYYSVPYRFVGEKVLVCLSAWKVRIFRENELICTHKRAWRPWEYVSNPDHAPPNAAEFLSTTRQGLLRRAGEIDESVRTVAAAIFEDRVADGLRPVRALLNLARKYSTERLKAACERATRYHTENYGSVKRILEKNLDQAPLPHIPTATSQQSFRFARAAGYFEAQQYLN